MTKIKIFLFSFLTITAFLNTSCEDDFQPRIDSTSIKTTAKRIQALENEDLVLFSKILDTEFDIYNVNRKNTRGIPGPSDWDYKIALKVNANDVPAWTKGYIPITAPNLDLSWGLNLIKNKPNWTIKSTPQLYKNKNNNAILVVYTPENIILKRVATDRLNNELSQLLPQKIKKQIQIE